MTAPFDPRFFGKTARNEQRKLLATTINTAGLAAFGIGFLTPAFTGAVTRVGGLKVLAARAILFLTHLAAQRILRDLKE